MDEREAIIRLKRGEIAGLEALVRRYQVQAVGAAYLITHDRALAEDIVQSAFLRAYERIGQFDESRAFGPWFLRSVANDALKAAARASKREPLTERQDNVASPAEQLERAETVEEVWQAIEQLPPEQRTAIVMRYYLDLSEAEIAQQTATPIGTTKWRLHAARKRLRELLRPWLGQADGVEQNGLPAKTAYDPKKR